MSFFEGSPFSVAPPDNYIGRVSGKLTGDEVTFTLRNISKEDGRLYGCKVSNTKDGNDVPSFDSVTLVVEGTNRGAGGLV